MLAYNLGNWGLCRTICMSNFWVNMALSEVWDIELDRLWGLVGNFFDMTKQGNCCQNFALASVSCCYSVFLILSRTGEALPRYCKSLVNRLFWRVYDSCTFQNRQSAAENQWYSLWLALAHICGLWWLGPIRARGRAAKISKGVSSPIEICSQEVHASVIFEAGEMLPKVQRLVIFSLGPKQIFVFNSGDAV